MCLSYDLLLNLGILSKDFSSLKMVSMPKDGCHTRDSDAADANHKPPPISAVRSINGSCTVTNDPHDITCSCPQCDVTLPHPSKLPFPCPPENNRRMKVGYLRDMPPQHLTFACTDSRQTYCHPKSMPHPGTGAPTLAAMSVQRSPSQRLSVL